MHRIRLTMTFVAVPILSGCMMGWMAGPAPMSATNHGPSAGLWQAEARNGDLRIALVFPVPTGDAPVPVEVRLATDEDRELAEADVWLRIRTPGGNVEQFRMEPARSSAAGTFETQYGFRTTGIHLVTAEARVGSGSSDRMASVTIEADVTGAQSSHRGWWAPAAILGGVAMVLLMALMKGDGMR